MFSEFVIQQDQCPKPFKDFSGFLHKNNTYIYINIMRGKKDVTTFPDQPVS